MRISDWSSDVCSSDLLTSRRVNAQVDLKPKRGFLLPRNAAQYRSRNCGDEHRQDIFQQTVSGQLEQSALAQLILTPIACPTPKVSKAPPTPNDTCRQIEHRNSRPQNRSEQNTPAHQSL